MHICSEFSILLHLLAVSIPHTENSRISVKACTKSCAISGRTEYTFNSSFWRQNLMAVSAAVICTSAADILYALINTEAINICKFNDRTVPV